MKNPIVFLALTTAAFAVIAQTASEVPTVKITASQNSYSSMQTYEMSPEEFNKFKGAYTLTNGMVLSLFENDRTRYAQIDDSNQHEIIAVAPNAFVAQDKQLRMRIDLSEDGKGRGELNYLLPPLFSSEGQITNGGWMLATIHR
jgi:hypothetical protein